MDANRCRPRHLEVRPVNLRTNYVFMDYDLIKRGEREVIDDVLLVYPFLSFKKHFTSFFIATSFPKIPAQILKKHESVFIKTKERRN